MSLARIEPTTGGIIYKKLPQELIFKVYEYVFSREYRILWHGSYPNHTGKTAISLSLLQTSKQIRADALRILFSRTVFKYITAIADPDMFSDVGIKTFFKSLPTTSMRNVVFEIKQEIPVLYNLPTWMFYHEITEKYCEETLNYFQGTDILRDTFRIRLTIAEPPGGTCITDTIIQSLKSFKGFKKLVVEIIPLGVYEEEMEKSLDAEKVTRFDEFMEDVAETLEIYLGPSNAGYAPAKHICDPVRWLEFHPREYIAGASQMETGR